MRESIRLVLEVCFQRLWHLLLKCVGKYLLLMIDVSMHSTQRDHSLFDLCSSYIPFMKIEINALVRVSIHSYTHLEIQITVLKDTVAFNILQLQFYDSN